MLRIRDALAAEIEQIREIERLSAAPFMAIGMPEIAEDEPTPADFLADGIAHSRLIVAEDADGAPVAFVMFREVEGCAYIEQISVHPSHARRRIGAALIDEVEHRAARLGWTALLLSTFRHVPWNAPHYARIGFQPIPDAALSPALLQIRAEHERRGLDETLRVFMRRRVRSE